jgi:transketolase
MDPIAQLAINTVRTLSIDAVQKANAGHPGLPLGAAPMGYTLFTRHLKHNPKNPKWPDRDRFVLSAGHGAMLQYALLHLSGYDLGIEDLKLFRQWGSRTPGHPETFMTPGVEATTGPLGQGAANAVGMAIAERFLANRYNRPGHTIVDHQTYALVSDGDMMEGISHEVASLAGHLKLGKLTYLYDDNKISLDGPTSLTFTEDVGKRFESYGWHVQRVEDGNTDIAAIDKALAAARAETGRPSIILVRTTIGFGSPNKANTSEVHGSPLGAEEVKATKKQLGWDPDKQFFVPDEVRQHFGESAERGAKAEADWQQRFEAWAAAHPDLAAEFRTAQAGELPAGWEATLPTFTPKDELATRKSGEKVIAAVFNSIPCFLGGDADLSVSTLTHLKNGGDFDGQTGAGRNIRYGVREHAMGGTANGITYHGGLRTFTATFFTFSDYERPALRLAALNHLPVTFVFTHDSIGLGEDGPTHQPVEHLASLRAMPGMYVVRPGDANEVVEAWKLAMNRKNGPTTIVLSRQNVPTLDRQKYAAAAGLQKGGYVVSDAAGGPAEAIIIGTGSELSLALGAQDKLAQSGIRARVVSLPCWEAFLAQDRGYQDSVIPPGIGARVSVEAGTTFGWSRFVGDRGIAVGLDRYGASAPAPVIFKELGFTADNVAQKVRGLLGK